MCPEYPSKDHQGKYCKLHPQESSLVVHVGLCGVISSLTRLGPIWVWCLQNYLRLLKNMES